MNNHTLPFYNKKTSIRSSLTVFYIAFVSETAGITSAAATDDQ